MHRDFQCLSLQRLYMRRGFQCSSPQCRISWWRHQMETFSALLAICAGNSPVPVNSPHKGQWRGALMFTLIWVSINGCVNNREAGDVRCYRTHYDVIVVYGFIGRIWRPGDSASAAPVILNIRPRQCINGFTVWGKVKDTAPKITIRQNQLPRINQQIHWSYYVYDHWSCFAWGVAEKQLSYNAQCQLVNKAIMTATRL